MRHPDVCAQRTQTLDSQTPYGKVSPPTPTTPIGGIMHVFATLAAFILFALVAIAAWTMGVDSHIASTYGSCQEDEVWAWFGDYPDDVVWRCIPADDLD